MTVATTVTRGARADDEPAASEASDARAPPEQSGTCFGCRRWTRSSNSSKQPPSSTPAPALPAPPLSVPSWSRDVARIAEELFHEKVTRLVDSPEEEEEEVDQPQQQRQGGGGGGGTQGVHSGETVRGGLPSQRVNAPALLLRVITWNTQLLEGVLPGQAGSGAHLRARAAVIAARLLELGSGGAVDVVVLQEVWHSGAAEVLRRALSPMFPHAHAPSAFCGLMVLSRSTHPHVHADFTKFTAVEGIEGHWFSKGVSATVIEVPRPSPTGEKNQKTKIQQKDSSGRGGAKRSADGERRHDDDDSEGEGEGEGEGGEDESRRCVIVLNAHTQSDFWKPCAATRARQFPVMVETLRRCKLAVVEAAPAADVVFPEQRRVRRRRVVVCGAVLCGDLNVEAGSSEYREMMRALGGVPDLVANGGGGDGGDVDGGECDTSPSASASASATAAFTFPLGRWSHSLFSASRCRYLRMEPTKRLDYVLDLTSLLSPRGGSSETRGNAVDEVTAPAGGALYAHAHVITRGLAEDHRGDPLSDHAPIVAHLAFN